MQQIEYLLSFAILTSASSLHKERVETEKHCERAKKKRKLTSEKYLEFKARQNLSEKKHKELAEKKRKRSMEKKKGMKEKLNL